MDLGLDGKRFVLGGASKGLGRAIAEELVSEWLERYMFAVSADPAKHAKAVAKRLGAHDVHKTHGRHISRDQAKQIGLTIPQSLLYRADKVIK